MGNFCAERNPFELALSLILVVVVPFLIFMTIVYILCAISPNEAQSCAAFCHGLRPYAYDVEKTTTKKILPITSTVLTTIQSTSSAPTTTVTTTTTTTKPTTTKTTPLFEQDPNDPSKYDDFVDDSVCPKDVVGHLAFPYVVSITEVLYKSENYSNSLRYLCSGAIISLTWVVSSSECINEDFGNEAILDRILIRAGSEYWSKEGVLHQVNQMVHPPLRDRRPNVIPMVVALEVSKKFMTMDSIKPLKLSERSMYQDALDAEVFSWPAVDKLEYFYRKKFTPLDVRTMEMYKEDDCTLFKGKRGIFCGQDLNPTDFCFFANGAPMVKDGNLVGVHIETVCTDDGRNLHYFADIGYYFKWLRVTTRLELT